MRIRIQPYLMLDDSVLHRPSFVRRAIAWITLVAYVGQPLVVTAQVIADQAALANSRPVVDATANGLPLVQITTPSAAGVSHNQYTQFNVDPAGLILNNSQTTVQTQQAGYITANPNLANSARVILNEITSTNRSQLNGYTEVAGQRAEVIIANPNGITCNGCGFINTSRGVLTTGTPVMGASGSLDAFRVTDGDIQIGANGLNATNLTQLDLITRSVQVNGELWATNLNVIAGANLINYNTLGVQFIQGVGAKPTVGIDVALLGGMYANKIRLIGTEAGVGVNSLGILAAQAGDFNLDNQGQITLGGSTTASGN
ncbi:MAG: filamentous hemagglutinin N-terminal domain-containing protein, partial [Sideroxyarcus sp.]|nr:filamentous hemagglutinin N-terminal domain-containing protein [Sideroxyarcus sp.]